jgi:protein-disulfide isomerase
MMQQLAVPLVLGRDHLRGSRGAVVTLVEYGDYECPHCGVANAFVDALLERVGDHLNFVFRHFPVSANHRSAGRAAQASEAAGAQGQFWAMHDLLLENHHALDVDDLLLDAAEIGLDVARFARDLACARYARRVREDCRSGFDSGVVDTPTFFINNIRHVGAYDVDTLVEAIRDARRRASSGIAACRS